MSLSDLMGLGDTAAGTGSDSLDAFHEDDIPSDLFSGFEPPAENAPSAADDIMNAFAEEKDKATPKAEKDAAKEAAKAEKEAAKAAKKATKKAEKEAKEAAKAAKAKAKPAPKKTGAKASAKKGAAKASPKKGPRKRTASASLANESEPESKKPKAYEELEEFMDRRFVSREAHEEALQNCVTPGDHQTVVDERNALEEKFERLKAVIGMK